MTTTIDQFANVPMPAGATWLGEWKRSPNGQAIRRSFRTAEFPITGSQIVVVAGGHQFVDNDRSPFILRTVAIAAAPDGTPLAVDRAHTLKLSDALEEAAAHIADLEDADTGLEVTQMTATHDTTADVPTPAGAEHVGPWVDGIREFDGTRRGENVHVDLGGNQ